MESDTVKTQQAQSHQPTRTIINIDNLPPEDKAAMQRELRECVTVEDETRNHVDKFGPLVVAKIYKQEFMTMFGNCPEAYLEDLEVKSGEDKANLATTYNTTTLEPAATDRTLSANNPDTPIEILDSSPLNSSPLDSLLAEARRPLSLFPDPATPSKPPSASSRRSTASSTIPNFGRLNFHPRGGQSNTTSKAGSEEQKHKEVREFFRRQ